MSDLDSDRDSLASIDAFEDMPESNEDDLQVENVREAVKRWKLRELQNNTNMNQKASGLDPLRKYLSKSARLYYDLMNYMNTSQNKESNKKDGIYMTIVVAIGQPEALSSHARTLLETLLQRDLVELPLTIEPKIVNTYVEKGFSVNTNFPDEE